MACGPGSPELSKSYMDMASKLFTFTLHLHSLSAGMPHSRPPNLAMAAAVAFDDLDIDVNDKGTSA